MTQTITLPPQTTTHRPTPSLAKVAGIAYVGAWVVGLTAFGAGPAANASDSTIARYFADHRAASSAQSLLIHGVAAVALLVLLTAMRRAGRATRVAYAAGVS